MSNLSYFSSGINSVKDFLILNKLLFSILEFSSLIWTFSLLVSEDKIILFTPKELLDIT